MGNELFGTDIAGIIADAMDGSLLPVTITKYSRAARNPADRTSAGSETTKDYSAQGFWEDFTGTPPPGVVLELNDRKAVLIGNTIEPGGIPERGSAITVHEESGPSTLYVVKLLTRDPAAAVYTYLCRDRRGTDGV